MSLEALARQYAAAAAAPPLADPGCCAACGRDSCAEHLAAPPEPRAPHGFLPAAEVMREPTPREIVSGGYVVADRITVVAGDSGAGKTFVMLDQAAAIGLGARWMGRDTVMGSVAYATFEGDAFGSRLRALRDRHADLSNLYVFRASDPISPSSRDGAEDVSRGEAILIDRLRHLAAELIAAGRPPIVAVYIDTVRASLSGSEDSSEHVSAYLRAVRRILAVVPGAGAVLVHHVGWQDGDPATRRRRERGSSAFRGNVDQTFHLEAEAVEDSSLVPVVLRALKVRDGERPAPVRMLRRRVDLGGFDQHGHPLTSCVMEPDTRPAEDPAGETRRAEERSAAEAEIDAAILLAIQTHPVEVTSTERIRGFVGRSKPEVTASVDRLIASGRVLPPSRQRAPYTLSGGSR